MEVKTFFKLQRQASDSYNDLPWEVFDKYEPETEEEARSELKAIDWHFEDEPVYNYRIIKVIQISEVVT